MPPAADRLKAVFDLAAEAPDPAARAALLDRECAGDPALRERVEALLRAHDAAGSFLAHAPDAPDEPAGHSPGGSPTADWSGPPPEAGAVVAGRYKLLEEIGEGGMGTVWMAEQTEPVKRRVAVKLIKPGMDSRQVVARFEAERQALALMDHPNIAKVLDGGVTEAGRPFFVMELVKGTPITRYCDDKRLPLADRLRLFADVCRAVQHAHQKGVIHRDLKPTNVLVAPYDGRPVVKVIDFGVAKAAGQALTERTLFTGFGAVVGTPEYMSPEQAELNNQDIDTRSDVYSLGVLLYELLTGTTPLTRQRVKQAALMEVLRLVREEEPPRPSTRLSSTAELPAIAAVRGVEPARLPREVRGELDWIVMRALEKDRGRRYETANGLAADVDRYLSGEPVQAVPPSAGYRLRKFARRNRRGLAAAAVLGLALLAAVAAVGWAVRDRAARADEAERDRIAREREAERERTARRERLEREVALAIDEVERAYRLDRLPDALSAQKRAEGLLNTGEAGEAVRGLVARWRAELDVLRKLEEVRLGYGSGKGDRRAHAEAADAELRRAFAGLGVDIDGQAPEDAADRIRTRLTRERLAEALDYWGWVRQELTYLKAVPQAARMRVHRVARLADPHPDRDEARLAVERWDHAAAAKVAASAAVLDLPPATLRVLAMVLFWGSPEQRATAMRLLTDAQARRPGDFWLNYACANYYHQLNPPRWAEAAHYYAIALALRPDNPFIHRLLGMAYAEQGKLAEAEAAYRRVVELDPKDPAARTNLAVVLAARNKRAEAIAEYRAAAELAPSANTYRLLGEFLTAQGKWDEAVAACRKGVELDPGFAGAHHALGCALEAKGDLPGAAAAFERAITLAPDYYGSRLRLGVVRYLRGDVPGAVSSLRRAAALAPEDPLVLNTAAWVLATAPAAADRDPEEAVRLAEKATRLAPEVGGGWNTLGAARYRAGDWKGATAALEKSMALRGGGDAFDWFFLAMTRWQLGEKGEARKWYDKAARWMDANNSMDDELTRFRAEAETLLGITRPSPEPAPQPRPAGGGPKR